MCVFGLFEMQQCYVCVWSFRNAALVWTYWHRFMEDIFNKCSGFFWSLDEEYPYAMCFYS